MLALSLPALAGAAPVRERGRLRYPTRPATSALNAAKPDMALPKVMDVISLNYQGTGVRTLPGQFQLFHDAHPDKVILSSEFASALSSRG